MMWTLSFDLFMCSACFQVGASTLFPPLHQPVLSLRGGRVFVKQRGDIPAAASLTGIHACWGLSVLLHYQ